MSRRFVPPGQQATAPSTPQTQRVLPTPPATETPAFRLPPAGNAVDPSLQRVATRPGNAQPKQQHAALQKLNISRFTHKKGQTGLAHTAADNRATQSPARASNPFSLPPQVSADSDRTGHGRSILGHRNSLLPSSTHQSPPMSPCPIKRPAQPTNSRFSSPAPTPAEDSMFEDGPDNSLEENQASLGDSAAHTSELSAFGQGRVGTVANSADQNQHGFQPRPAADLKDIPEDGSEGRDIDSPSPAAFSKRRADEYNAHKPAKRTRSRYACSNTECQQADYSQTQSQPEPSTPRYPDMLLSCSLDAYIDAHPTEWLAAKKRWQDCSMDEWTNGPAELVLEFNKVMDMVKDFMIKRMEVYTAINKDVDTHKLRLDSRDAMLAHEKERLVKHAGSLSGSFVTN